MFAIDDNTPVETTHPTGHSRGLVPRDISTHPHCYSSRAVPFTALDMPLIPREQWVERAKELKANRARLSDIRRTSGPGGGRIPSLDQDGVGYCWNHSGTMAVMLLRAKMNQPYVRLSAFMVGCLVKNYRDEGGWGAQGLDFIAEHGVPSVDFWEEKSMRRSNDTPEMRANALKHRAIESWVDLDLPQYDRNFTEDQAMTLLLTVNPVIGDFNWWGHSVCLMDAELLTEGVGAPDFCSLDFNDPNDFAAFAAVFGKRGINSWTDEYGEQGEFVLKGSRARLDGGAAPRVVTPSVN